MRHRGIGVLIGASAVAAALTGCSGATCGEGTIQQGAECVVGGTPEVAKQVADQVVATRRRLGELKAAFDAARKDRQVQQELSAALAAAGKLGDRPLPLFHASRALVPETAVLVMQFAAELQIVDELIAAHATQARLDEAAIAAHRAQADQLAAKDARPGEPGYPHRLRIVLANPDDGRGERGGRVDLVELGGVFCGEPARVAETGRCPDDAAPAGIAYRSQAKGPWKRAALHLPGSLEPGAAFPLDQILLPTPGDILTGLVEGNAIPVAEVAYFDRLARIRTHVMAAFDHASRLEAALRRDAAPR